MVSLGMLAALSTCAGWLFATFAMDVLWSEEGEQYSVKVNEVMKGGKRFLVGRASKEVVVIDG